MRKCAGRGAFVETIKVYQQQNVIEHLWNYGGKLINGMNAIARELGVAENFNVYGVPCSPNYLTKDKNGEVSMGLRTLFSQEMIKNGVLMPWIAISLAHGEAELEKTLEATRKSLQVYARAVSEGYEKYLKGEYKTCVSGSIINECSFSFFKSKLGR